MAEENNHSTVVVDDVVVDDNNNNMPVKLKEVVKAYENKKKRAAAEVDPTGEHENDDSMDHDKHDSTTTKDDDDGDGGEKDRHGQTKSLPSGDGAVVVKDSIDPKNVQNSQKHNVMELEVANQMMDFLASPAKESLSQKKDAAAYKTVGKNQKEEEESNDKEEAADQEEAETDEPEHSAEKENEDETAADAAAAAIPLRPIKRARTAYFIFADDKRAEVQKQHPGEGVAVVARVLGQLWANMNAEDKQIYQDRAAQERERVSKELQAWKDAGGLEALEANNIPAAPNHSGAAASSGHTLIYPIARIRKICKLDPEVRGVSKEAIILITKAAELATSKIGRETVRVAQIQNRRKLLPEDVAQVCATREQFLFLREDIQDLARRQTKDAAEKVKSMPPPPPSSSSSAKTATTTVSEREREATSHSKPLTSYFAPKPKN